MLICRKGEWRVESDGYVSSSELRGLEGLREMEASRAQYAEYETAHLADRVRALKRRAWRRGYEAGRRAALCKYVASPSAASFASRCLEERLADVVLKAVAGILGEMPADQVLPGRLRKCLEASVGQRVLSLRVSADDYDAVERSVRTLEHELNAPLLTVLADAGLPPHSLVVETEHGVIDGSLTSQLRTLERGMRGAIKTLLDEYHSFDGEPARELEAAEGGLRDVIALLAQPWDGCRGGEGQ